MPFAGLGLHIILALLCAVHAVRSRQNMYWLFILFAFPLLGSLVYFFAIYLPNSRLQRGAFKAVSAAAKALDPSKEVRAARADLEHTPTAQNQMRLAAALLDVGETEEAATLYASALKGPFASDPELRYGAARAFVACQHYADALEHLDYLRSTRADYRADGVALLQARAYAGMGLKSEAHEAFESCVARFGSFEAYAEYAIWALDQGDTPTATQLQAEIDKITRRWTPMNRELNAATLRRLNTAQTLARKRA